MKNINENLDPTLGAASYNVQGSHTGYVYRVLNLNRSLEQKTNKVTDDHIIHVGCTVTGYDINDPEKKYTGQIIKFLKNSDGVIKGVKIKSINTNKFEILSPEKIDLIIHKEDKFYKPSFALTPSHNIKI